MKFCSETESAGPATTLRTIVATNGPATSITPIKTARPGSICNVNITCRLRTTWCELGMHRPVARAPELCVFSTPHCLQLAKRKHWRQRSHSFEILEASAESQLDGSQHSHAAHCMNRVIHGPLRFFRLFRSCPARPAGGQTAIEKQRLSCD